MANIAVDRLDVAERALGDFINGRINVAQLENKLSAALTSCKFFDRNCSYTVSVVRNTRAKEPFFGARVFPALDLIDNIVEETVSECRPWRDLRTSWQKIDKWVIELDSSLFDRNVVSLTPKETMAIVIHELGHTVYSDKVLERFYRGYRSMHVHMKNAEKDTIKLGYGIFTVALATSCGLRSWVRGRNGIREEFFADKIVRDCNYGEFYVSALDKIISAYGSSMVGVNDTADENAVSERCRWGAINIVDTVRRREKLATDMSIKAAETKSEYLHALYARTLNAMGIGLRERYSGDAVESEKLQSLIGNDDFELAYEFEWNTKAYQNFENALESHLNRDRYRPGTAAFESIFRSKVKQGLPSWADIDRIDIEIDRMANHNDRTFVLDMIYAKIDDINSTMEYAAADPAKYDRFKPEAERMMDRLNNQRDRVLAKRSFANRYSVFVKVPEGYEG